MSLISAEEAAKKAEAAARLNVDEVLAQIAKSIDIDTSYGNRVTGLYFSSLAVSESTIQAVINSLKEKGYQVELSKPSDSYFLKIIY